MDSFDSNYKTFIKGKNLSKKDIISKLSNIKVINTPIINNQNKNKSFNQKYLNLAKKNLTYTNIYDYNYSNVNISGRKIKNPVLKLKQELLYDTEYSSFISKNSNYINSDLLITGLNFSKKTSSDKNFFQEKKNIIKNYSNKNIDSNIITNKKIIQCPNPNSLKSIIHFNRDIFYNPMSTKGENTSSFMEKSRIIRREKIRKFTLEDKYYSMKEANDLKFDIIRLHKDEYFKNLSLFCKFGKSLDRYLGKLELETNKQYKSENYKLKMKIYELKKDINKLTKKINYLEYEKAKYQNVKKFLISANFGTEALIKKENNKEENSLFLTETNYNNDSNKMLSSSIHLNNAKKIKQIKKLNISPKKDDAYEKSEKVLIKKYNSTALINSKSLVKKFSTRYRLNNIFVNYENSIINSLYSLNNKKNEIFELEKKLKASKSVLDEEFYYNNMKQSTKAMKLFFKKKENIALKTKYNSIKKETSLNEGFMIKLEQKIYNILININKEMNIQEKINIKNLFNLLSLKDDEFFEKMKINKLLYMIKIIELFSSFLINLTNKYSSDPKMSQKYEEILDTIEKEKSKRNLNLNKERIKQKLDKKKKKLLKKFNQIRFFTYKKYDVKYKKNKQPFTKKIDKQNSESKINYEPWLTYT